MIYPASAAIAAEIAAVDQSREPILIVEDHFETRVVYERYFRDTKYQVYFARSEAEARNVMHNLRPRAILLDIILKDADTWGLLSEWKGASGSRDIPIIVVTDVEDAHKGYGLGADEYAVKPVTRDWLLETLDRFIARGGSPGVLVIDDDVVFRYLVRQLFSGAPYEMLEAEDGGEGLSLAARRKPDLIFLDLAMSGMDGFETLRQLRAEPETAAIPVIVATSKILTGDERRLLTDLGAPILSKEAFSSKAVVQEVNGLLRSMDLAGLATGSEGNR